MSNLNKFSRTDIVKTAGMLVLGAVTALGPAELVKYQEQQTRRAEIRAELLAAYSQPNPVSPHATSSSIQVDETSAPAQSKIANPTSGEVKKPLAVKPKAGGSESRVNLPKEKYGHSDVVDLYQ